MRGRTDPLVTILDVTQIRKGVELDFVVLAPSVHPLEPLRGVLYAIPARTLSLARAAHRRLELRWGDLERRLAVSAVHVSCCNAATTRVWKLLTSSPNPLWGSLS